MTLTTIMNALELYINTLKNEDERLEAEGALAECQNLIKYFNTRDIWRDAVHVVSPNVVCDMLSNITYDDYGKLAKANNGTVTREQYHDIVRSKYQLELTDDCVDLGYEIVSDLWNDNESLGDNNPDGTFAYN